MYKSLFQYKESHSIILTILNIKIRDNEIDLKDAATFQMPFLIANLKYFCFKKALNTDLSEKL